MMNVWTFCRSTWTRAGLLGLGVLAAAAPLLVTADSTVTPTFTSTAVISTGAPAYTLNFTPTKTETVDVSLQDLASITGSNLTALASVNLVVTANGAIQPAAGSSASAGSTPPQAVLAAPGTVKVAVTAGTTYQVRVVGVPTAGATTGNLVSVGIASDSSGTTLLTGTNSFVVPTAPNTVTPSVFTTGSITVPAAGSYTFSLVDRAAPVPLAYGSAFLIIPGQQQPVIVSTTNSTQVVNLTAGKYTLTIAAVADPTAKAGLFSLHLGSSTATVVDETIPVGAWMKAGGTDLSNPTAQPLTLTVTDLQGPTSLAYLDAVVTSGATLLGQASSGTPATFAAPAGTITLWSLATAASGNAGGYTLSLAPATGSALFSATQTVTDPTSNLYSYVVAIPSAGSYSPSLTDLEFPAQLTSLAYSVYQGGSLIGTSPATAAPPPLNLQAGPTVVVVTAVPNSAGDGVYSVALLPTGSTTPTFARIQSVGPNLLSVPFTVTTPGAYDIGLSDLGWPANFSQLNGLVTVVAATQLSGFPIKILGSATFPNANLPAGNYVITLNGTPGTGQTAGLYTASLTASAPTVTLSANPTSVTTGNGTHLTWSSTNSTGCTATTTGGVSGATAFSGSRNSAGALDDGPYSSTGTVVYTLACTGPGGTGTATTSVTVTQGSSSGSSGGGGGGGGGFGALDLAALALLASLSTWRRRSSATPHR